jgi:magnesium-transporting ATPase (P-type)
MIQLPSANVVRLIALVHLAACSSPCDSPGQLNVFAPTLTACVDVAASHSQVPPWSNPYLLVAMAISFGLHFLILYVPVLAATFDIVPLSVNEWKLVIMLAAPVIVIDELLKLAARIYNAARRSAAKKAA